MSNLRIGGLATGMDLESIVKDLMKVEQLKVDKLEQQKTKTQWQQEAYHNINKTFANFILDTQKAFGLTKAGSTGFIKQSVSSLNWVKSAISGDKSILEASARADAIAGTHTINVKQLASNWSAATADKVDGEITLGENEHITFTVNEIKFSTDPDAGEGFKIIPTKDSTVKLVDMAKAINQADIGVIANFDASIGRFFLQTTKTGNEATITITDDSNIAAGKFIAGEGNYLKLQYVDEGGNGQWIEESEVYQGKNAIIDFGAAKDIEFQSNQFTLNNIDFTIKSKGETSVTIDTDVDGVYNKVLDFVAQYNALVDKANNLLGEKQNRTYLPLTNEQKEQMSEKEIELWEEKAKSGLLYRDMYLTQTIQQMRSGLYQQVQGVSGAHLLSNFGITTERYVAGSMGGKLEVDEAKLKEAIKEDVNSVLELLFSQPDSSVTDKNEKRAQTGIVSRIYGDLIEGMKSMINKAGTGEDVALYRSVDSRMLLDFVVEQGSISFLQKDIAKLDDRISNFQFRMLKTESRYWAQFTALEKAINRMNAQAAWLAQQFGGGQ